MPNPSRPSVFRLPPVTSVEARGHTRIRVARNGSAMFELSLPMMHQVDEWAARQSPPLSRSVAIAELIRRGLSN